MVTQNQAILKSKIFRFFLMAGLNSFTGKTDIISNTTPYLKQVL